MEYKTVVDVAAMGAGIGSWLSLIPDILSPVAALFSIIWLGLRIWETETVKNWTGRGS